MKKLLLLITLPFLAITFNSCSDNKGENEQVNNEVTFNGKTYQIAGGGMHYYGNYYSESAVNIDLVLVLENGGEIYFEMGVPNGHTKLIAGTYTYSNNTGDAFTFWYSDVDFNDEADYFDFANGTVKIAVLGNTYTITINGTDENNKSVKGTYSGPLSWYDEL